MTGSGAVPGKYQPLERLPTGIAGLDEVLKGGVFRGGVYIVQGTPGAGKTILGNQISYNHIAAGGRALYVTLLAESHARMLGHMAQMSFFDHSAVPDRITYLSAFRALQDEGLAGLLKLLRREVGGHRATLLILDGLVAAQESAASALEFKKFIHELQTQAAANLCTCFLLTSSGADTQFISAEHTMVDGLIELSSRPYGRRAERELEVRKLRGGGSLRGRHSFRITDDGLRIFPRTEALYAIPTDPEKVDGPHVTTGNPGLDAMLSGGLPHHSTTMLIGPAGIGKTTTGLQFLGAVAPGENALFCGFYESTAALKVKARTLNLPAGRLLDSGQLDVMWHPATEGLVDEFCHELLERTRRHKVRRLFIDGLDGVRRIAGDADRVPRIFSALAAEFRAADITAMFTTEIELLGPLAGLPLAGVSVTGVSAMAENILLMRFVELRSEMHRMVSVLKARDTRTESSLRRFVIADGGIAIDGDARAAEAILAEVQGASSARNGTSGRQRGE